MIKDLTSTLIVCLALLVKLQTKTLYSVTHALVPLTQFKVVSVAMQAFISPIKIKMERLVQHLSVSHAPTVTLQKNRSGNANHVLIQA